MTARIPLVNVPPSVEARLDAIGARTINVYRALANQPALLAAYIEFTWSLRRGCSTSRRLRELMIVRGAQVCESAYELDQHVTMALNAGVTESELNELGNWREARFSAPERAALQLMDEILEMAVTDSTIDELRRHFSDAEIVELIVTGAFYCMVPRILNAFGVPLDSPDIRLERPG